MQPLHFKELKPYIWGVDSKSVRMKSGIQIIILVILMAFSISNVSCGFGAGSYAGAKDYEFNTSSQELVKRIEQLKEDKPSLNWVTTNEEGVLQNKDGKNRDYYLSFYFILPVAGKNAVVLTIIDKRDNYPAVLKLDCITYSLNGGDFVWIDKLKKEEREILEASFKKYVLDEIGYEPQ